MLKNNLVPGGINYLFALRDTLKLARKDTTVMQQKGTKRPFFSRDPYRASVFAESISDL